MTQVIHSLCFELNHHVVYINRAILKQNKASFKGYNVFIRPDFQQELSVSVSGHACPLCFWLSSETYWLLSRPALSGLECPKPHRAVPNRWGAGRAGDEHLRLFTVRQGPLSWQRSNLWEEKVAPCPHLLQDQKHHQQGRSAK